MKEKFASMDIRDRLLITTLAIAVGVFLFSRLIHMITINATEDLTLATVVAIGVRSVIIVAIFLYMGGAPWLRFSWRSIRETWGFALPLIIFNSFLGISLAASVLLGLLEETITGETFLKMGALATLICLLVGLNEEVMFRGVVLGGLLAKLGNTTQGIVKSAVISSLIFGAFHVVFEMNYTNIYSVGTGLMKTLETALFAFILCVPVIRGKNLWGAITAHAFFDWIILCGEVIRNNGMTSISYAQDNPEIAVPLMIFFGIVSLLYLPFAIRAYFKLKEVEAPQLGPLAAKYLGEEHDKPAL